MFHKRMKEAKHKTVNGIQIFVFPLNHHRPPFLPYTREAVFELEHNNWRWRDTGSELSHDDYTAIVDELARRRFEEKLRKVGVQ